MCAPEQASQSEQYSVTGSKRLHHSTNSYRKIKGRAYKAGEQRGVSRCRRGELTKLGSKGESLGAALKGRPGRWLIFWLAYQLHKQEDLCLNLQYPMLKNVCNIELIPASLRGPARLIKEPAGKSDGLMSPRLHMVEGGN